LTRPGITFISKKNGANQRSKGDGKVLEARDLNSGFKFLVLFENRPTTTDKLKMRKREFKLADEPKRCFLANFKKTAGVSQSFNFEILDFGFASGIYF
jgi:hypothetical protein